MLNGHENKKEERKEENKIKIKKYKSAYILFSSDSRKLLKTKFPNLANSQLTKLIGMEWKNLDLSLKNEYYKKEAKEKEVFEKLKKDNENCYEYNKSRKYKKPIRFRTPYMFYIMNHKNQLNNSNKYTNIQLIKQLSQKWNHMTELEKSEYIEKANNDKKRYTEEWENFLKICSKTKIRNFKRKDQLNKIITKLFKHDIKSEKDSSCSQSIDGNSLKEINSILKDEKIENIIHKNQINKIKKDPDKHIFHIDKTKINTKFHKALLKNKKDKYLKFEDQFTNELFALDDYIENSKGNEKLYKKDMRLTFMESFLNKNNDNSDLEDESLFDKEIYEYDEDTPKNSSNLKNKIK